MAADTQHHKQLNDAINARAEAEAGYGKESPEFKAADSKVSAIQKQLPKPMGATGPRWK